MLKLYLGDSGAGKTYCIKKEVELFLKSNPEANVYVCSCRDYEWNDFYSNNSVKISSIINLEELQTNGSDLLIFDAMETNPKEFLSLLPYIVRRSVKTNVIVALQEYAEEYKQLFFNAYVINYMRMCKYSIIGIPETFLNHKDKEYFLSLMDEFNHQEHPPFFMLEYRNGSHFALTTLTNNNRW